MPGEATIVARGTVSHTLRHDATNKMGCAASGGKMLGVLYACMGLIFCPFLLWLGWPVLLLSKHNKLRIRAVRQQRLSPR